MPDPPQPDVDAAYEAPGNPITRQPLEKQTATSQPKEPGHIAVVAARKAHDVSTPDDTKFEGFHGAPPGEEAKGLTVEDVGRHRENEGEQMATPGEGRVADAVRKNTAAH